MVIKDSLRRPPGTVEPRTEVAERVRRLAELNDELLLPLIETAEEDGGEEAIDALLRSTIHPLLDTLVRRFRRLEPSLQADDFEEISSAITLRLIRKLRAVPFFEEHAIATLENYVATLAYNTLYDFRRQRHPERHRLKKALRYVLTTDSRLALWENDFVHTAGLAQWAGSAPAMTRATLEPSLVTPAMTNGENLGEAAYAVLRQLGAPVPFDALVTSIAQLCSVREAEMEPEEFPPDEARDPLTQLEERQYLEVLWREIQELPEQQRSALLLNLRDRNGGNALTLFLLLGIATLDELARAAGMTARAFEALWEELPLDDLTIGERLGLQRQQVINLRKAARARLGRRMARH